MASLTVAGAAVVSSLSRLPASPRAHPARGRIFSCAPGRTMIREMREKLSGEIDQLSHELNVLLPQAIAQAVELGDLRENSEHNDALARQKFVQRSEERRVGK